MKQVIIAEKPSVAQGIAKIVGATERYDGYLLSPDNETCVTWALGHLIQLAMPEDYSFVKYKREELPFLPESFRLVRRMVKTKEGYKLDEGGAKQLEIIQKLFSETETIVCATDAGREGELIFRYIYNYLDCHKPFYRLWVNNLTDKALREGLNNLKPGADYDNLYLSAKARSQADWLIGINASQALTISAQKGIYSLGRVQTPTLTMICKRYLENKSFKPSPFWQIKLSAEKFGVEFSVLSEKYTDQDKASEDLNKIESIRQLTVEKVEENEVQQTPPLLFDLTSLQQVANVKYGLSADKTLRIAQKLYENKLISYPRTSSRYLPEDVFEELPQLIENLEQYPTFANCAFALKGKQLNRKSVNDNKVTDHHALIITQTHIPLIMEEDETRIFDLIAGRMLEAVSENCVKLVTKISFKISVLNFQLQGNVIQKQGWRNVFNIIEQSDDDTGNTILPVIKKGEMITLKSFQIVEKKTKPQPLFTEASLLEKMETAGKDLTDEEEREAMKSSGLGTPATRAAIIETLFRREYIRKEKKLLLPTNKGLAVFNVIKSMKISDVQMTGYWENFLSKIEKGEAKAEDFQEGIIDLTKNITQELLSAKIEIEDNSPVCICPKCKIARLQFFNKVVKCSDQNCGFVIFKNKGGKDMTDKHIQELFTKGRTGLIKGFKNKDGRIFDAHIILGQDLKLQYDFPPKKQKKQ